MITEKYPDIYSRRKEFRTGDVIEISKSRDAAIGVIVVPDLYCLMLLPASEFSSFYYGHREESNNLILKPSAAINNPDTTKIIGNINEPDAPGRVSLPFSISVKYARLFSMYHQYYTEIAAAEYPLSKETGILDQRTKWQFKRRMEELCSQETELPR